MFSSSTLFKSVPNVFSSSTIATICFSFATMDSRLLLLFTTSCALFICTILSNSCCSKSSPSCCFCCCSCTLSICIIFSNNCFSKSSSLCRPHNCFSKSSSSFKFSIFSCALTGTTLYDPLLIFGCFGFGGVKNSSM